MLEDSGYMARAAFVMDRFMRWIGLPGEKLCAADCGLRLQRAGRDGHPHARAPARPLDDDCHGAFYVVRGAPAGVCVVCGGFFPRNGQNIVFSLYLIGIIAAVFTGLVLKNSLLKGEATPFIMELPPYRLPTPKGILIHTWNRLKGFIVRAGRVIVPMVLVLSVLNAIGTDGSYGNENSDKSMLAAVGRSITPALSPMGLQPDNWPASVGIFTGVLAKKP